MGSMLRVAYARWLAVPLAGFLYFCGLSATGLLGPDEPRYAAVAGEMARSGDWVTPRLWGEPWFEKPPLLYWMTAAGFHLGLGPELAPRLPVAALALAFLGFYWWILRREFGTRPAWYSVLILGTSVGWFGFSQIGVTDMPLTVTFSAAMLLALPWIARGDTRPLPFTAALLGLAVLAKGLVPLVLALPLLFCMLRKKRASAAGPDESSPGPAAKTAGATSLLDKRRGQLRDLLQWRVVVPFLIVALPWYVLCYLRNGRAFLDVFFWQQQFGRFTSSALQHSQPWWFNFPVLAAGLLPWTPLAALLPQRGTWRQWRVRFLLVWVLFGLLFFSMAVNKLPGYVLPLLPAICALIGITLDSKTDSAFAPAFLIAVCALLLIVFPMAAHILPEAVSAGLRRTLVIPVDSTWLLPAGIAILVWVLARRGRRWSAVTLVAAGAAAGIIWLKVSGLPDVDRRASARGLWREIEARRSQVCIDAVNRNIRYGLNYYSGEPLPDCAQEPRPLEIHQHSGELPSVTESR
jgi:4-amino-4-deoxy-L-arabinose transferase-like glycosyltransferase